MSEGVAAVSIIRKPRRPRRCAACTRRIFEAQVRLFGNACAGDPMSTLYLHPECAAKSPDPRVVAASSRTGAAAGLQQPPSPLAGVGGERASRDAAADGLGHSPHSDEITTSLAGAGAGGLGGLPSAGPGEVPKPTNQGDRS